MTRIDEDGLLKPDIISDPFFIVGVQRSGTTLLRLLLDRHPEIGVPPESHFIPEFWKHRRKYGSVGFVERPEAFLADLSKHPRFREWELPIDLVARELSLQDEPSLAQAIGGVFRAYAKSRGKGLWGDKTPSYTSEIALLACMFPRARFIHIVRDGRDVALSQISMNRLHRHAATCALVWRRILRRVMAEGQALGVDRYHQIRYEDLVEEPEQQVREVLSFLDVPFSEEMLRHDPSDLQLVPTRTRHMHTRLALPVTKGLRDWRREMDSTEVAEFECIAGRELDACGYPLTVPKPGPYRTLVAWTRLSELCLRVVRKRAKLRLVAMARRRRAHAKR
jgi:hypothetical protein